MFKSLRAQTFQDFGLGRHTIVAEFRDENGTGTIMTKGAQNYYASVGRSSSNGEGGGGIVANQTTQPNHSCQRCSSAVIL